ncbi:MAG TPA: NADH-quinone oxidoreductase subunit NuoG [Acidimicrobiales bacterium]|jgi:NADH-quinone oxidoreductase subunit G
MPDGAPGASPATSAGAAEVEAAVHFVLDGAPATARPGELLISAAERVGTFIPRFCYHPRMKPVGMCRMCLVEVSGPRGATLQPACYVPVAEGMEVVTDSAKVKKAQDGVLEFLLVNHPLDCPVCDKGGECPLQDQTLAYGPGESRFVEEKRHFAKPIPISELVLLDRERCIQCARCTRFAEEVAGEAQIDFAGRGDQVEVAVFPSQPFSSYFSGNTVQICPVGALTATPYRFAARPWDLDQVESTCTTCSVGCRVAVQSSANRLTRILGIDSDPVNHGWLCDKGRFVFESVNGTEGAEPGDPGGQGRLLEPMVRRDGVLQPVSWAEALAAAAAGIGAARDAGGPEAVGVLGGARSTNEGAYAWARVAKGVIGTDSVDAQLGDGLPADLVLSLPRATIDDACAADVVVVLAGDLREELPVLYLRLREAVREGGVQLVELAPRATPLTPDATVSIPVRPGEAPVVVRALAGEPGAVGELALHPEGLTASEERLAAARDLLGAGGARVVVVVGRPSLAEHPGIPAEAARLLAERWPEARFLPALRRGNVMGALDMGLAPGLLPGRVTSSAGADWFAERWGSVPAAPGLDATGILASLAGEGEAAHQVKALVLLGSDPLVDFPDRQLAERAFGVADFVVAVAGHLTESVRRADVVLPAAVAHERPGTTTNIEGRVTRLGQKLVAPGHAWPDWTIAVELAAALGVDLGLTSLAQVRSEIARWAPAYRAITQDLVESTHFGEGRVVPLSDTGGSVARVRPTDPIANPGVQSAEQQGAPPRVGLADMAFGVPEHSGDAGGSGAPGDAAAPLPLGGRPVAVAEVHVVPPNSYSLRLASTRRLYDSGSAVASSPSLAPLVGGVVAAANPYDLDRLGVRTGDPVRIRATRATIIVTAKADAGVPRGVVVVEFNLPDGPDGPGGPNVAATLIDAGASVTDVRLESV